MSAAPVLERLAKTPEKFPGALLLTGPSAERLAEEARRLAAILLCPGDDKDRRCESCRRAIAGLHPDLTVVQQQGVQIRIDAVREALAFGAGKPYESSRRVAIVSRAEILGAEAANALLKTLEEPGKHFHWILTTTRAEALLSTVRSRCVAVALPSRSRGERIESWTSRGFSPEDSAELADIEVEDPRRAAEALEEHRAWRGNILAALEAGVSRRAAMPLLMLAEALVQAEPAEARLFPELLADAAVASAGPSELLRHRSSAAAILRIAQKVPAEVLRGAAIKAADAPPDNRRGNKRLHYESVLLDLLASLPPSSS